jgi:hypothetical protein
MDYETIQDDLRLTAYRLRVVEAMPNSPRKAAHLVALRGRIHSIDAASAERPPTALVALIASASRSISVADNEKASFLSTDPREGGQQPQPTLVGPGVS